MFLSKSSILLKFIFYSLETFGNANECALYIISIHSIYLLSKQKIRIKGKITGYYCFMSCIPAIIGLTLLCKFCSYVIYEFLHWIIDLVNLHLPITKLNIYIFSNYPNILNERNKYSLFIFYFLYCIELFYFYNKIYIILYTKEKLILLIELIILIYYLLHNSKASVCWAIFFNSSFKFIQLQAINFYCLARTITLVTDVMGSQKAMNSCFIVSYFLFSFLIVYNACNKYEIIIRVVSYSYYYINRYNYGQLVLLLKYGYHLFCDSIYIIIDCTKHFMKIIRFSSVFVFCYNWLQCYE